MDAIITRWLKRHLQWLGAGVNLEQLNSLVGDRDILAENLENWAKKERMEGRQEGEQLRNEQTTRNLASTIPDCSRPDAADALPVPEVG